MNQIIWGLDLAFFFYISYRINTSFCMFYYISLAQTKKKLKPIFWLEYKEDCKIDIESKW